MNYVCVFCGSQTGLDPAYADAARAVGRQIVARGQGLVYGGGSVGLMGVVADAVLAAGGPVIGVIPRRLAIKELLHTGVPDMRIVASMHERKALMADIASAFVALPGGYGTLEELFEIITWAQLGEHQKTIGILNPGGYFDSLLAFVENMHKQTFVKEKHRGLYVVDDDPMSLLRQMDQHQPPQATKWIDRSET
jgi:uncharacterized protein (TIGR00730 family)